MVRKDQVLQTAANMFMALPCACYALPFLLLIVSSLTDESTLIRDGYSFLPEKWSLYAYKHMSTQSRFIIRRYAITVGVIVTDTIYNLILAVLMTWPLSKKSLPHRNKLGLFVYFTILFDKGVAPIYIIQTQVFRVKDTYLALTLPNLLMSAFYIMVMRIYFSPDIPDAAMEAARIDGAEEFRILTQVVLSMPRPVMIALTPSVGLEYWNGWVDELYCVTKPGYYSVQVLLNRMLEDAQAMVGFPADPTTVLPSTGYKITVAVAGTLPVLTTYPSFQRCFVRDIAIGVVKS